MSDDSLNARLKVAAEGQVGKSAITSKFGIDCFALPDKLLRELGAQTAADGDVAVTAHADYDWGDEFISLGDVQPGDILQFKDHLVSVEVWKYVNDKWYSVETSFQTRPHHSAIVVEVLPDGSVVVVEQNVKPNPRLVSRNVIPRLEAGDETRVVSTTEKKKIKVTGQVRAYHPAPKSPKGASLFRPGQAVPGGGVFQPHGNAQVHDVGVRALAHFVPLHGGARRAPGPLGMEVRAQLLGGDFTREV